MYLQARREKCVHYVFLVSDPVSLLSLLDVLYYNTLDLLAKFVLVTHLQSPSSVLSFLQASPINKMTKMLLVTPSSTVDIPRLHLYTHLFFVGKERVSLMKVGAWPPAPACSSTLNWFPQKLTNFHGFKLRATTFQYPPFTILERGPAGGLTYGGLEVGILLTLASALNFTVEIVEPRDGEKWGTHLSNGTWTGAVGETIRGETDVSFANYFITADRLKIMDMTRPYYIDYTCFVTPKPRPLPQYTAVTWPFQVSVWAAVGVAGVVLCPAVHLAGRTEPGTWFLRVDNCLWYVLGIFLTQPQQVLPQWWPLRVVVLSASVGATVLTAVYRSALVAFLLVPLPVPPINSLQQLLQSGLHWGVRDSGGWEEWFRNSLDPTSQRIAAGFEYVSGIEGGLTRVLEGNFAFMNSGTFLRYLVASNFTDGFGVTKLHVAKECFVPFRIGLAMPRFSVFTSRFNTVVARIVEAGMVTRLFQDLLDEAVRKRRRKAREREEGLKTDMHVSQTTVLGLYHLQVSLST
ncbi:ionotropic receptor 21a-like [Cherax quadricarinatus]|uniref:ionotropic receptor 21a-like n=1 Tax=Cherax quadricarinatus TaxID=27406 RepID=UPI00387E8C5D